MKKILLVLFGIGSFVTFPFTEVNTKVCSKAMKKDIPITVVLPNGYSNSKKYNTIYVLHGWSGSNKNYPEKTSIGK